MSNDNLDHLDHALHRFLFSENYHNNDANNNTKDNENNDISILPQPSFPDLRIPLEDLTRQIIRAVSSSDAKEHISLPPSMTMMAIHSIGKAASICVDLTEEDENDPNSLPFAAMEFMTTAFGYLEPDLVYTALRLPLKIATSQQQQYPNIVATSSSSVMYLDPSKRSSSRLGTESTNQSWTVVDVLARICVYGAQLPFSQWGKNNHEIDPYYSYDVEKPWFDSKLRVFAFISLCRGIQAAEIVQKFASSIQPFPTRPEDSALGAGLGLELDLDPIVEDHMSHFAVDYILYIDAGGNNVRNTMPNQTNKCSTCAHPTSMSKRYQTCACESNRSRGYLYTACATFLSTLLRSNMNSWLHFTRTLHNCSDDSVLVLASTSFGDGTQANPTNDPTDQMNLPSQHKYTEQQTIDLCDALARCVATLNDRSLKVQGRIAGFVSISLMGLILQNTQCPLENYDNYAELLETISLEHVIRFALSPPTEMTMSPMNTEQHGDGQHLRAQYVMRKRAITAFSDIHARQHRAITNQKSVASIQFAIEETCARLFRMGGMDTRGWENCMLDPALEGDLICFLVLITHCQSITRPLLKKLFLDNASFPSSPQSSSSPSVPQKKSIIPLVLRALIRLSVNERFITSTCSSSILIGLIQDRRTNLRNDLLTRRIWGEIETLSFCQQEVSNVLVHTLVFLKKSCDLKSLALGENFDPFEHIGYAENPFKVQLYRSEPRLCSLLDLCVFFFSGDVLRNIKLDPEFCHSTMNVFSSIISNYIGKDSLKMPPEHHPLLDDIDSKSNLSIAVNASVEAILTRLGYLDLAHRDKGSNDVQASLQDRSECRDPTTSRSLMRALSLVSKHKITDENIPSEHASVGITVASCLIQGYSRDLIRRGMMLYTVFEKRKTEYDIVTQSVFEVCSLNYHRLTQTSVSDKKHEEEYNILKRKLAIVKRERDQCSFSLHRKTAQFEKELSFAKLQAGSEAMALVDSHIYEREAAEKHAMNCQSEMEKMKKQMEAMEMKLRDAEGRLEQNQRESFQMNQEVERLRNLLTEERNIGLKKDQAMNNAMRDLSEAKQELGMVTDQNNKHVQNVEAISQLHKESQEKVETTCFKLVALAQKYKEKESVVNELTSRLQEVTLTAQNETNKYNSLVLQCKDIVAENRILHKKLGKNIQNRNQSAIAAALQEMENEVPGFQKRDDETKSRGRSLGRK